jgi:hypothetical protein
MSTKIVQVRLKMLDLVNAAPTDYPENKKLPGMNKHPILKAAGP